jgi:uncharacterized membrane protein YbhN (UPF0104 family)
MLPEGAEDLDSLNIGRAIRRALLSVGLGLFLLYLLIRAISSSSVDLDDARHLLEKAQWGPLFFAFFMMVGAFILIGYRWRALLPKEHQVGPVHLTSALCSGFLLNYVVPGPFGEFGAAWLVQRRHGVPLKHGLAAGLAARVIGLCCAAIIGVLAWAFGDLPVASDMRGVVAAAALMVAIAGGGLAALVAYPEGWHVLRRFNPIARLDPALAAVADALSSMRARGWRPFAEATAYSLASHAIVAMGIFIAAASIGAEPSLSGMLFTYTTSTAGIVALFALPGSQIGWDALFFGLLVTAAGLHVPEALALTVFIRLEQFAIMGIGALAMLIPLPDRGPR